MNEPRPDGWAVLWNAGFDWKPARKMGRCANGAERDSGRGTHAVLLNSWRALCGTEPGRRSAGWSERNVDEVTCPRCLRRLVARAKLARPADDAAQPNIVL